MSGFFKKFQILRVFGSFWHYSSQEHMSISNSGAEPLGNLLIALASDHISPGSGTAAAAAMAFAAACAAKALAISRKHRAADEPTLAAQGRLAEIIGKCLQRADVDSACFEAFIHHRNRQTALALINADQDTQALAVELLNLLDQIEPAVHPVVAGDILAARVLLNAATRIQARICDENRQAAAGLL
jgi:formiminotetrahydrofolate cyclodeaminase